MYSMKDIAAKYGISQSTIRYYDKEGLLPFMERTQGGIRFFTDTDIEWLDFIITLKDSGMSVKDIRQYIECLYETDDKEKCLELFKNHQKHLVEHLKIYQNALDKVNHTIWELEKDLQKQHIQQPSLLTICRQFFLTKQ